MKSKNYDESIQFYVMTDEKLYADLLRRGIMEYALEKAHARVMRALAEARMRDALERQGKELGFE